MSSSSTKVLVVQNDKRAVDAVRLGFVREGLTVICVERGDQVAPLLDEQTGLVVAGADGTDAAKAMLATMIPMSAPNRMLPQLDRSFFVTKPQVAMPPNSPAAPANAPTIEPVV